MKSRVSFLISIVIIFSTLIYSISKLSYTIAISDLRNTLLRIDSYQTGLLLLMSICLNILFILIENSAFENLAKKILVLNHSNNSLFITIQKSLNIIIVVFQTILGIIIPISNLLGFFTINPDNNVEIVLKVSLLLLNTYFLFGLYSKGTRIKKILNKIRQENGIMTFLNREGDHIEMSKILDNIEVGSEVLVTHFEEPINELNIEGYYYEEEFMKKWYSIVIEKKLVVNQVVLINSKKDIEDFKKRLDIIKDIENFSLGYIIAPPLTVFMDFIVFPNDVLIGFSDKNETPNMNTYGLLIHKGEGVTKFKNMFNEILVSKATFVKTFEGTKQNELDLLDEKYKKIKKFSKTSRTFFKIFTEH